MNAEDEGRNDGICFLQSENGEQKKIEDDERKNVGTCFLLSENDALKNDMCMQNCVL